VPASPIADVSKTRCPIEIWSHDCLETPFPYDYVIMELRRNGKHFASRDLTAKLLAARSRARQAAGNRSIAHELERFLDIALDKVDGTYNYITYTAMAVLGFTERPSDRQSFDDLERACDLSVVSLMTDAVSFECSVLSRHPTYLPLLKPEDKLLRKRCVIAFKAIRSALGRLGMSEYDPALSIELQVERLRREISAKRGSVGEELLERSMLPVYVVHDEHLFIRVLQSFETVFYYIAEIVEEARDLLVYDAPGAISRLNGAADKLVEISRLFAFLSTMKVESFHEFRKYTEGASAIQSTNYKDLESLCRRPPADRLDSIAYHSVPQVRAKVKSGRRSLDDTFRDVARRGEHSSSQLEAFGSAMSRFSDVLVTWRRAHYGLAVRMLGQATGTGYTEGTPYLKAGLDVPVFETIAPEKNTDESG
jgi:tryptophan 2,3-dioxygenase